MATGQSQTERRGSLRHGAGHIRLGSGLFEGAYSYPSRFEGRAGTSPEELLAAAHAECFSMALAAIMGAAGHTPQSIRTSAKAHLNAGPQGPTINRIELAVEANVPGLSEADFRRFADTAKTSCAVSRALAGVETMTLDASLCSS